MGDVDLIVIGAGMAGINAAARASEAGAHVVVIERDVASYGDEPVVLHVPDGDNLRSFRAKGLGVTFCPELASALADRLGPAAFRQELPAGMPALAEEGDDDELLSGD